MKGLQLRPARADAEAPAGKFNFDLYLIWPDSPPGPLATRQHSRLGGSHGASAIRQP